MFVLYNIIQWALLLVFFPFLLLFVACSSKYRDRVPARLGAGLAKKLASKPDAPLTIWVHALSVGEVTSAVPLVRGLREKYPTCRIIVSTTTRSGKKIADSLLVALADGIVDSPLDFLPVVHHFIRKIRPNLFILVETDFWPNILGCLKKQRIPAILVNGRVSGRSMVRYHRMGFFFRPMFHCFSYLSMQTVGDKDAMEKMGLPAAKLPILGNLKFAAGAGGTALSPDLAGLLPKDRTIFLAGSTHSGEEQILFDCYLRLRSTHPELLLVIAPRHPARAAEIATLADKCGLQIALRTAGEMCPTDVLILDTLGELADFYGYADFAFIGGSLVDKGGHNPIEPATMAIPVLFGPHMEDFSEIAESLVTAGGAVRTDNSQAMVKVVGELLDNPALRLQMGKAAEKCVRAHNTVINNHLQLIDGCL